MSGVYRPEKPKSLGGPDITRRTVVTKKMVKKWKKEDAKTEARMKKSRRNGYKDYYKDSKWYNPLSW